MEEKCIEQKSNSKSKKPKSRVRKENCDKNEIEFFSKCSQALKDKDEEYLVKATRLSISKFDELLNLLKERLEKYSRRKSMEPENRLALTLMYLAHGCSPQVLAVSYEVGLSTIRNIIYDTLESIWEELNDKYVPTPNEAEWKVIADGFRNKSRMPNCIGAIEGKHVNVVCPKSSGTQFFNYKNKYSVVLVAACDSNYTFTLVDIVDCGSKSDGGIFGRSDFGKEMENGTFVLPPSQSLLNHTTPTFPLYFVGGAAFPLKKNLMRPYPGKNLTPSRANFNKRLSKALCMIENALGILSYKWRILHNIHCAPENVDKIVLSTVVLHNFLMQTKDSKYFHNELVDHEIDGVTIPGQWRNQHTELISSRVNHINRSSKEAFELRDELSEYLLHN